MFERIGWAAWAAGLVSLGIAACGEGSSGSASGGAAGAGNSGNAGGASGSGASGGAGGSGGTAGTAGSTGGADASAGAAGSGGSTGCTPGAKQCKGDTPETCDAAGQWQLGAPCQYGCDSGACKDAGCKAGEFNCHGNEVQQCDPGPPAKWVPKAPSLKCYPTVGQACNAATGTCEYLQPLPAPSTIGTCHVYTTFNTSDGVFKGGYDVDSFGDSLYINRSGQYLDVYQVALEDTDGDGKLEPEQHPDNPLHTGPVEGRKLAFVKSYSKTIDQAPLGPASISELYAKSDRVFILRSLLVGGFEVGGSISEYVFATKATTVVVGPQYSTQPDGGVSAGSTVRPYRLGFGDADGRWYGGGGGSTNNRVFSWHAPTSDWVVELQTSTSNIGGLEVVVAPATGHQYVYTYVRTSPYAGDGHLDQYRRDPSGWAHTNQFKLGDVGSYYGMGFGALDHFWLSAGSHVIEVGGGDCAQYLK
ncbi:MAG: hypothetical protein IPM35_19745 [Myxococcales bacterium]|nr:hypothetical protein [Myxococcales bacterium]